MTTGGKVNGLQTRQHIEALWEVVESLAVAPVGSWRSQPAQDAEAFLQAVWVITAAYDQMLQTAQAAEAVR